MRWEGTGSGFENSSGAGGIWKSKWVGPSWAQVGGPKPGPSGWAHAGPKWVGPRWAQVGGPTPGPSWAQARNLGPKNIQKIKILKIKIRSAQNVGKVFLSRKKTFPAPFGAFPGHFLRGPEKSKKCQNVPYFPSGPSLLRLKCISSVPQKSRRNRSNVL